MISVNDVRYAVNMMLEEQFSNIPIHDEGNKQGLTGPCFFVELVRVTQDGEHGRRYRRHHSFDIHYFPSSGSGANEEMHNVAEQLYDCMEYIKPQVELIRGHGMKHEIADGVLRFFVDYNFHVIRPRAEESKIQNVVQEGYIK